MKTKSSPTIKKAVEWAFAALPDQFRGNDIHRLVKLITSRKFIHTDSSLRKMRQLRKDKVLNFRYVGEKCDSLYEKQPVKL